MKLDIFSYLKDENSIDRIIKLAKLVPHCKELFAANSLGSPYLLVYLRTRREKSKYFTMTFVMLFIATSLAAPMQYAGSLIVQVLLFIVAVTSILEWIVNEQLLRVLHLPSEEVITQRHLKQYLHNNKTALIHVLSINRRPTKSLCDWNICDLVLLLEIERHQKHYLNSMETSDLFQKRQLRTAS